MKNFDKYSRIYDLIYKDKNYKQEVAYIEKLIKRYSDRSSKSLFDIGCGTGSHGFWFMKKGYSVTGIDRSAAMISIAKKHNLSSDLIEFRVADAKSFSLSKKFNIAVSLFHVMSYLTANKDFIKSLNNIHKHLNQGGLFIFDFWYGPAVLTQKPEIRRQSISNEEISIKRTALPKIDYHTNTVDVFYKIIARDKLSGAKQNIKEHHLMRYFFLPELSLMLENAGFEVIKCLKWMSLKEGPSNKSWSALIIAKKIAKVVS